MKRLAFPLVAALAAFVGCTSIPSIGPSYKEPTVTVEDYRLPDAGKATSNLTATCEYKVAEAKDDDRVVISKDVIAQWWTRFDDPVLASLVETSVSNNLTYRMAQRRLEQAEWQLLGSYAGFLPKFTGNGAWTRTWANENTTKGNGKNGYNMNVGNLALDGKWEIDIFGGNRRLVEAAMAQAEASGWTVADAWIALTTTIGKQYINLRTIQERIDVARTNLVLQSETYDILKSRLDSGIGDELALNQCAYIVEETRARIPTMLAQEEAIKNALAVLAGQMPGALHEQLKPVTRRDWLLSPQKVAALPLNMMRSRPDVKAAERNLAAQTARIGVAEAQWFPKFYINGSVGWEQKNNTSFLSRDSFFATLGPSISWPIFQGGAVYANVKAQEAKTAELVLAYEESLQKAYSQVRDSYSAYTQEQHRYRSLRGAVRAATDAVTISTDLYKNGLRDFNNVLDAQRSRFNYEEQMVISRGNISLDLIDLYKALGGGLAVSDETAKK